VLILQQEAKKILIIDSKENDAIFTSSLLKKHGYKTEIIQDSKEAIQRIKNSQFSDYNLILMEIELEKGTGGAEVASEIQKYCDIPIVFLSSHTEEEFIRGISSVAKYGFVVKNTGEYVLASVIDLALRLKEEISLASFYQKIVESSMNEIYIFRAEDLKFIMVNQTARKNLGYGQEELAEMTPLNLKPEEEAKSFENFVEIMLKSEKNNISYDTVHIRKDGTSYPLEVNLQLYSYEGRKIFVAWAFDLTARKEMEENLLRREALLSAITQSTIEAIVMLNEKGRVVFWNPAAEKLFGYSAEEVMDKNLHELLIKNKESLESFKNYFRHFQLDGTCAHLQKVTEFKTKNNAGDMLNIELSLTSIKLEGGYYAIGVMRDIEERKKTEEAIYLLTITDPLLKIYNRRYFTQKLKEEIERVKRTKAGFSLIMMDIDHFKTINDDFGHQIGDQVLLGLAETIKQRIRKTDIFARWGGEEFVILLPDTNLENAVHLAEELLINISSMEINGARRITASFGVTSYREGDTLDTITKRADDLMYEAKAVGRNCVRWDWLSKGGV